MGCRHGMPSPASCFECMTDDGLGAAPEPPELADSRPFKARKDGDCGACHLPIFVGQDIVHTTRDRYVHDLCARR